MLAQPIRLRRLEPQESLGAHSERSRLKGPKENMLNQNQSLTKVDSYQAVIIIMMRSQTRTTYGQPGGRVPPAGCIFYKVVVGGTNTGYSV